MGLGLKAPKSRKSSSSHILLQIIGILNHRIVLAYLLNCRYECEVKGTKIVDVADNGKEMGESLKNVCNGSHWSYDFTNLQCRGNSCSQNILIKRLYLEPVLHNILSVSCKI